jgi:hypothetical protein
VAAEDREAPAFKAGCQSAFRAEGLFPGQNRIPGLVQAGSQSNAVPLDAARSADGEAVMRVVLPRESSSTCTVPIIELLGLSDWLDMPDNPVDGGDQRLPVLV